MTLTNEELGESLRQQYAAIESRKQAPTGSLTSRLLQDDNLLVKKLGEEFAEIMAAIVKRDSNNYLEEMQQAVGWLPMVCAVAMGIKADDYLASLANLNR